MYVPFFSKNCNSYTLPLPRQTHAVGCEPCRNSEIPLHRLGRERICHMSAIYVVMLCFTVALCILPRDPVIHLHPMACVNLTRCANSSILQGMPPVDPVSCQPRVMVLSMTLLHLYSSYCTQYIVVLDPKRMQHLEGTIISIPHAVRMK